VTSPTEIIAALERAPGIVIPMVRQADPTVLKRRPPTGKWCIHEHACHLAEVNPHFLQRLELMLTRDNPAIQSYDPGRDDAEDALLEIDLDDALNRFALDRGRMVMQLRELRPGDWWRTGVHDEYNSYSVFTMFRHLALHDFFHAYRIEELLLRRDWPRPSDPM
jgi:DinB family protein